jgi:predicted nuclease of predicted toxin-antitoxin system
MRFLVDEDVDIAVGGMLANRGHDVRYVVQVFGAGAKDPTVRVYLRAMLREGGTILITADNEFARRSGQKGSRLPCLWLRDLPAQEYDRAVELCDVIESEAEIMEDRFFMEVRGESYHVRR